MMANVIGSPGFALWNWLTTPGAEMILKNALYWAAALLIAPIASVMILSYLGNCDQQQLVKDFGQFSQGRFGFIGVIIHEFSHMLAMIVTCHKVDFRSMHLFNFRTWFHYEPTLGNVNGSFDMSSSYQTFGNLLVGAAPVFGCSIVIGLLHKWLLGKTFLMYHTLPKQIDLNLLAHCWRFLAFWSASVPWYDKVIFGLLTLTIVVTGYGLSNADWKLVFSGFHVYCFTAVLIDLFMSVLLRLNLVGMLRTVIAYQLLWCLQGSVYLIAALVILFVIGIFRRYVI